jgi:asparagine synthase (glutamine-hydrolysing)
MSGICAVLRKEDTGRTAGTLQAVGRGLALVDAERLAQKMVPGAGVAVSAVFDGQQVYSNEWVLVGCDAEIYNEAELQELVGRSNGLPQLLAALYHRFGCDFVAKLNGDFSIVLWDRRERKLLAAVDPFGVKRLVWFENDSVLLLASRIDALMRSGEVAAGVNPRAIASFLNFGVSLAPETIFTEVKRLAPGTLLDASKSGTRIRAYWDMRYGVEGGADEKRLCRELEGVVEQAVAARYKDEGAGAFLSGGTDSSTVVGMMSRLGRGPVPTFSIGFEEQRFNELGYAEITARRFHAAHHTYLVGAADCLEAVPKMVRFFDEPFANSSAIPTYFCARLAAENGVPVLLAGDGGDELFGGNERYLTDKIFQLYQNVPRGLRKGIVEPVLNRLPFEGGPVGKAKRYVRRSNMPVLERFFSYNLLCTHPPEEIFARDFLAELAGQEILEVPARYYQEAPARDHLERLLYVDVKITLGDSDLPKVTEMARLAGVRTRFPFLDRAVAEFSGRVPARLKVKGFDKRYLFKRAFRNLLPIEVLRKKKHGFGIPVATWLKTDPRLREFSRDILFSRRALERGYFQKAFLEDLVRKHEADDSTYYGDNLWTFFVLELWHRQFVDQTIGAGA